MVDGGSDDGTAAIAGPRARASHGGTGRASARRRTSPFRLPAAIGCSRSMPTSGCQPGARAGDPGRHRAPEPTAMRCRAARAFWAARCAIRAGCPTTCCGCSAAAARFTDDLVHERVVCDGGSAVSPRRCALSGAAARGRGRAHGPLFDRGRRDAGRVRPPRIVRSGIAHGLWSFLRTYVLRLGFLDGREGFLLAVANAEGTYYRYMKAWLKARRDG